MKFVFLFLISIALGTTSQAQTKRPLDLVDIMKFNHITRVEIGDNGAFIAYVVEKDRGDGEGVVRATNGTEQYRVPRGTSPKVSAKSGWVAMLQVPPAAEVEKAGNDKKKKDKLKNDMVLVNTGSGRTETFKRVKSFHFSDDELWLAVLFEEEEKKKGDKAKKDEASEKPAEGETAKAEGEEKPKAEEGEKAKEAEAKKKKKKKEKLGTKLLLRRLQTGDEYVIEHVMGYEFDPTSSHLAYHLSKKDGEGNGLFVRRLQVDPNEPITLHQKDKLKVAGMAWPEDGKHFAWVEGIPHENEKNKNPVQHTLMLWQVEKNDFGPIPGIQEGTFVPANSNPSWSKDGQRLFFGVRDIPEEKPIEEDEEGEDKEIDLYDLDAILDKTGVDVWHDDDPLINPMQKKRWARDSKRNYTSVYHVKGAKTLQLADKDMRGIRISDNAKSLIGTNQERYAKAVTWEGTFADIFMVDLKTGERNLVVERATPFFSMSVSPSGRYLSYYKDSHIHLYDSRNGKTRNLTEKLDDSFFQETWDYPSNVAPHGFSEWLEDDSGLLAYSEFDVWFLPTKEKTAPSMITAGKGRETQTEFRVYDQDRERDYLRVDEDLLLTSFDRVNKDYGFFEAKVGQAGVTVRLNEDKYYSIRAKAKDADVIIYSQETFEEYPDLWTADSKLNNKRRLSTENPQLADFQWGKAEIVRWKSTDGRPLDGVLIKPAGYQEGTRYPVLVYYYRIFSNRLHRFTAMRVNHRPNLAWYASNGYAVFLPDILFDVGEPGMSAVRCLVPGAQKLIDMGIAKPDGIALHGHSWSGYQTSYVITQTDIFACAIAGAPVSNMTSAYSGIRLGTGMARQFQYEKTQSRIGGTLWEARDKYIDNSPVFFADRINTPLMIMFGDEDTAVPWQQGIELYLALRRFDKDCIFLQYRGEPHGLRKYPNKLDYTLRMREYIDHYTQGKEAPEWITEGILYQGK